MAATILVFPEFVYPRVKKVDRRPFLKRNPELSDKTPYPSCLEGCLAGLSKIHIKKGFCSGPNFEILSAPYDKQRKVNLHEPLFHGKPVKKRQMQRTEDESFHRI